MMQSLLTYSLCLFGGLLGIAAHMLLIKIPALKAASSAANFTFSFKAYFAQDWLALASSLLAIIIGMFVLEEVAKPYPMIMDWLKWIFIVIGFTGSTILQAALGKTAAKINCIVDEKTNIADGIKQP